MPPFKKRINKPPEEEIKERFLELYETADELKDLFKSILPKNSLLKTILKIDTYQDRNEVCDILLSYLGNNFFATLGKIRADEQIKDKWGELTVTEKIEMLEEIGEDNLDIDDIHELDSFLNKSFSKLPKQVRKKIEVWNEKSLEPKYILREKLLQKICQHDMPDEPDKKEKKIVSEFNKMNHQKDESISQMVRNPKFIATKNWRRDLCHKILRLPDTVAQSPKKEPPLPETISLQKRSKLLRLREYQTQGLLKVQALLTNDEDYEGRQKRILVNLPTGAGKTRLAVESVIEWLNLREQGKTQNANPQQMNPNGLIFWFASTDELCTQASTEFSHIYDQIGAVELLNLTNYYGADRRSLDSILNDKPGTHIVITNRHHFFKQLKLEKKKEEGKKLKRFNAFKDSQYFKFVRKHTIAIIIDEAHEVTGETYQDFLAAMGFNFSGTIESRKNINTNNIVLIGLTATAYKGSGLIKQEIAKEKGDIIWDKPEIAEDVDPDLSDFVEFDKENDLDYFKKLNPSTKLIHKIFGGVYIPNPQENTEKSRPIPVIDIPITAHVGDSIKISGINSFDNNVQIESYSWKIVSFHAEEFKTKQPEFYYKFPDPGTHTIILTVTNQNNISETDSTVIKIFPRNKKSKISGTGSLEDNVEFYKILEKSKVLCKVIHGVIDGPHLNMKDSEIDNWKRNRLSAKDDDAITLALEYNQKICEIISKCITTYGKQRVLLFAHTVKHSQELMLILKVKYKLTAASVDGKTNPGVRRKIVKEFIDGKIQVLCNFGVFTTGFDVPKIDTLLICREVGRNALYTQMIGRGQRGENAGGTPNLWLITSQFPKPKCQQEEKLKLGWEALASTWEKFPDEIKDDLGLGTWEYEEKYVSEPKEKESIKDTHQIKIEPIEELELECQTCHIRKKGLKDNLEFYGYDKAYTPSLVKDVLKQKDFPRHCLYCRPIRNIAKKSQDEFVKYVAGNHEFNPHFLMVIFFANMPKSERQRQGRQAKLSDLVNYLWTKWHNKIPKDDFNIFHPIIHKLERDNILEIDNYLNLKFKKIIDTTNMEKILSKLSNHPALKKNCTKILNEYQSRPTSKRSKLEKTPLEIYYEKLKKELGHTPTRRQFESKLDKNLKTIFTKQYQKNYKKFLGFKRVIIKDDLDLKDALYDEYFEKCMRERSVITRDQLDAYGDYRIEDYEDVWGSFNKFQESTSNVLTDVLENMDEKLNERDKEFEEISKDLIKLKRKIGTNFIHFDEIWQHGGIRIFRYIIQLKISHLKYLEKYHGQYLGEFLRVISDYFRLKKTLGRVPTSTEFTNSTPPSTTAAFLKVFKGDYDKFLKIIGDTPPDSTSLGNHA